LQAVDRNKKVVADPGDVAAGVRPCCCRSHFELTAGREIKPKGIHRWLAGSLPTAVNQAKRICFRNRVHWTTPATFSLSPSAAKPDVGI
jgi:hypothetical protein